MLLGGGLVENCVYIYTHIYMFIYMFRNVLFIHVYVLLGGGWTSACAYIYIYIYIHTMSVDLNSLIYICVFTYI